MSIRHRPFALLLVMARLAGIEPTTPWFVAKYSIQLSYSREERNYIRILSALGSFAAPRLESTGPAPALVMDLAPVPALVASACGRDHGRPRVSAGAVLSAPRVTSAAGGDCPVHHDAPLPAERARPAAHPDVACPRRCDRAARRAPAPALTAAQPGSAMRSIESSSDILNDVAFRVLQTVCHGC